jgi:hypothetical protein
LTPDPFRPGAAGVWRVDDKNWLARFRLGSSFLRLGIFGDELSAARAYDAAARKYRGREAVLNFPRPSKRRQAESQPRPPPSDLEGSGEEDAGGEEGRGQQEGADDDDKTVSKVSDSDDFCPLYALSTSCRTRVQLT